MFIEIVFHSHSVTTHRIFQAEKCSWYGASRHPRFQKRQRVSQHSEKNLGGGERGKEGEGGRLCWLPTPFLHYLVLFSSYHTIAGGLCSLHSPSRIAPNLLLKT